MIDYIEFSSWPCYGCEYAIPINHFIPVYKCTKRQCYLKKKPKCRQRKDDDPSNWYFYEKEHKAGRF